MNEQVGREYCLSRKSEILALFDTAWRPFIASRYGDDFANTILREAREQHEALIPEIPYPPQALHLSTSPQRDVP